MPTEPQPTATELLAQIHGGKKSCVALIEERLARIDAVNPILNCCTEVLYDSALAAARAVDAKIAQGLPLKRLEGLPIVVKINIDVAGTLSTAATPALAEWRPTKTAPVMEALLAEGAIVLAKTGMPELAVGMRGGSLLHGLPKNPFSLEHNAGGSSTGTGVSVAAGIVPCGLGSDTAGSLRIPAACNGGVGMRPSKGRWSGLGVVPCSSLRDTAGPMGATVTDVALLDAVVKGEPTVTAANLLGIKVVVAEDWIAEGPPIAPETREGLELAITAFKSAGASVTTDAGFAEMKSTAKATWEPPLPVAIENCHGDMQAYLDYHGTDLPEGLRTVEGLLPSMAGGDNPLGSILRGFFAAPPKRQPSMEAFEAAISTRDEGIAATEEAYKAFFRKSKATVVLMPVFPKEPTHLGDPMKSGIGAMLNEGAYTSHLCMHKGVPAIVLPTKAKWKMSGVPVGIMLYGIDDREVLSVALALEEALKS